MTDTGQAMGTADYMAPEQASDSRTVDIRADLYSLGCTLYKLLSGRAPFSGPEYRSTLDKLNAHVHQPAPLIRQVIPGVPEELAAVLDRLLAKDPDDRFARPAEVAEALAPWCVGADLPALLKRAEAAILSPRSPAEPHGEGGSLPKPLVASQRWRSRIQLIVLLLLVGGLGLILGITIRITRDGKQTTIELPEGSNAYIGASGHVDVTLPGQTKAAGQIRKPKEPPLQFGPVIERVVNSVIDGKGGEGLDLVGGTLVDVPKEFGRWSAQQQDKWSTENNVDLVVDFVTGESTSGSMGLGMKGTISSAGSTAELLPKGLKLAAIWRERWDNASRDDLRSALTSDSPGSVDWEGSHGVRRLVVKVIERRGAVYYTLSSLGLPVTFAFQTRKGDLGVLQVIRFTEEPRGVRLRYKLAQPPAAGRGRVSIIEPDALDSKDAHEFVSVMFPLNRIETHEYVKQRVVELRHLLGPHGSYTISYQGITVIDEAGCARQIRDWLKRMEIAAVRPAADLAALQGQWSVVRAEKGESADRLPSPRRPSIDVRNVDRLVFHDRYVDTLSLKRKTVDTSEYTIDPLANPKTIDIDGPITHRVAGEPAAVGIYDLQGNRLRVCLAEYMPMLKDEQRPTSFTVEPHSGNILFTLDRCRPSEADKAVHGRWRITSEIKNGKPSTESEIDWKTWTLSENSVFFGERRKITPYDGRSGAERGKYFIDDTKDPKSVTIFPTWHPFESRQGFTAIYKLDGDQLTVAYGRSGSPPETFESKPGSGVTLLVLEREKPGGSRRPMEAKAEEDRIPENPPEKRSSPTTGRTIPPG